MRLSPKHTWKFNTNYASRCSKVSSEHLTKVHINDNGWDEERNCQVVITYNAITQNNCFVKGSHKYDVYLRDKHKVRLN